MAVLDAISFDYKKESAKDNTSCSICMDNYIDKETVYRIPDCQHFFHEECMRTWLLSKNQESE